MLLLSAAVPRLELATSTVVYGEVVEGLYRFQDFGARHLMLRELMREVSPLAPTPEVMDLYAQIRRQLRPPYGPGLIGDIDTIIAATALTHDLTLVTTDTDFLRVPSLRLLLLDRATLAPVQR